jgi:hypothetical protein
MRACVCKRPPGKTGECVCDPCAIPAIGLAQPAQVDQTIDRGRRQHQPLDHDRTTASALAVEALINDARDSGFLGARRLGGLGLRDNGRQAGP